MKSHNGTLKVYGKPGIGIMTLQQRSPVLKVRFFSSYLDFSGKLTFLEKSRKEDFVSALLEFVKTSEFACVLFLSGVDMLNRTDAQML
jgi:proteasome assembly chaperone 2